MSEGIPCSDIICLISIPFVNEFRFIKNSNSTQKHTNLNPKLEFVPVCYLPKTRLVCELIKINKILSRTYTRDRLLRIEDVLSICRHDIILWWTANNDEWRKNKIRGFSFTSHPNPERGLWQFFCWLNWRNLRLWRVANSGTL